MKKLILFGIMCLCLSACGRAAAQDPLMDRLARLEANNASLATRLSTVEMKMDRIGAKIDDLAGALSRPRTVVQSSCANGSCGTAQVMSMGMGHGMSMSASSCGSGGGMKMRGRMRMRGRSGGCG